LVRRTGVGPGPGPSAERVELTGPLPRLVDEVIAFVDRNTQHFQAVVGRHRETLSEYPPSVIREAVLNALAHRDYGLHGTTVDITVWDDRIEIQSPGPLPGHITPANMRHEHYSRNRRIMRTLKILGLVEEYGEGVDRMIRDMEARLMEPPDFRATSASVTVVLRNRFVVDVEDQVWLALLGHFNLSPHERRALVAARRDGDVTPRRLREYLPGADVESVLRAAIAKGLLVRVGHKGGARYVLSDEVILRAGSSGLEAQSRKRQMLLEEMRRRNSISTQEGATLLDEDLAVVRHLLNDLVSAGLAEARGNTRARRYHAL
jgi:ATP-dependent DNA helicase RecG